MRPLTRRSLLLLAALPAAGARADTVPAEVRTELGEARLQGKGRMRFLGLSVYDIRLWARRTLAEAEVATQPLALEIEYARALDGRQIAERSLVEMRRGGPIDEATAARWLGHMARIFPDVAEGDRITGVQRPGQPTRFFFNGRLAGEVPDLHFAAPFFGIWLAGHTSEPRLREQLLGRAP